MDPHFLKIAGLCVGAAICSLVLLQLFFVVLSSAHRNAVASERSQLELELLRAQIAATRRRQAASHEAAKAWEGWRKFEVKRKVAEARDVASFYLVPHDQRKLAPFSPGQYLTFQLNVPGQPKSIVRCYSLSDGPREDYYRVTIKRVPPPRDKPEIPPGLSSNFFHDSIREGDILDVKAPHGAFYLDLADSRPIVLIGGGIGLTPVLSMLNAVAQAGVKREVWFFLGVRNRLEHAFKEHLQAIAREHEYLRIHICYSDPAETDTLGQDYHHAERVSADLFKKLLPSNNYDFYICGPGPMMQSITEGLKAWGVPDERVHFEAFGPASVKKVAPAVAADAAASASGVALTFSKSGKTVAWAPTYSSVLELAEANGITIDSGCRAGNCGTCITAVKSGKVKYPKAPGVEPEAGSCLTCICVPDGPLTLDA